MSWLSKLKKALEDLTVGPLVDPLAIPAIAAYIEVLERNSAGKQARIPELIRNMVRIDYPEINVDAVAVYFNVNTCSGNNAVTIDQSIYFPQEVDFFSPDGLHWLLHEMHHCVQYRRAGGVMQFLVPYVRDNAKKIITHGTLSPHDFLDAEREADAKAYAAMPRCLIDPAFYLSRHPDIREAFGDDHRKALEHWFSDGIREGRDSSPAFSVRFYLDSYQDLKNALGNSGFLAAYRHWLAFGLRERRVGSRAFSVDYYLGQYGDLQQAFGIKTELAARHWFDFGIAEGRRSSPELDVRSYVARYPDVYKAFHQDWASAINHYLIHGISENRDGRSGAVPPSPLPKPHDKTPGAKCWCGVVHVEAEPHDKEPGARCWCGKVHRPIAVVHH